VVSVQAAATKCSLSLLFSFFFGALTRTSESGILEALGKRHSGEEIYSSIGSTLISVNPYKQISGLYGQNVMKKYVGKKAYQNTPHAYAVAERAYRNMQLSASNECIVITGESGSGKTEASKVSEKNTIELICFSLLSD